MNNLKSFFNFLFLILLILSGCNKDKEKQESVSLEPISRVASQKKYPLYQPEVTPRAPYPWEKGYIHGLPRITKEFFRCNGGTDHLPFLDYDYGGEKTYRFDCEGGARHSLPLRDEKEYIYPILIDLLNYLQEKTRQRVIITCGHRCPEHNTYADPSRYNQSSKHLIGAEVDFYVDGYEQNPEEIISLLIEYYSQSQSEYREFLRLDPSKTDVVTSPWYNKEVLIKLYLAHEGRDRDTPHPYPYLSLQVRYDKEHCERVIYTWEKATRGYRRY